ncbi:MAG: peptide chain release factor N(5)-glutamine methyltransferase [Lactobacillales bacterium]|jgi:release factor glutamine methyltransferase|nr:peptide chain release factor N(5)-glutamine methyltransferase [Lactobacillales bacterium]
MNQCKTYFQVVHESALRLQEAGCDPAGAQFVFLQRKGWNQLKWLLNMHHPISEADYEQILRDAKSLLKHLPPQYLLGVAEFFGRRFKVTKDTLIPRSETEELVQFALQKGIHHLPLKVIDIGVGSGVIALTLALECPNWQVMGVDISEEALEVARENANLLEAEIRFAQGDVLDPFKGERFDIIISNPPYIAYDEWNIVDKCVREYEPEKALFADENGLAVYLKIAKQAPKLLKKSGILLLEIGYKQAVVVSQMMREAFANKREVKILKDMSGKPRIVYIKREEKYDADSTTTGP